MLIVTSAKWRLPMVIPHMGGSFMRLFLIFFWLTLYSSIAWTLVAAVRVVFGRRLAKADTVMLGTASIWSLIGIYMEFFWDQERRLIRVP